MNRIVLSLLMFAIWINGFMLGAANRIIFGEGKVTFFIYYILSFIIIIILIFLNKENKK